MLQEEDYIKDVEWKFLCINWTEEQACAFGRYNQDGGVGWIWVLYTWMVIKVQQVWESLLYQLWM